MPVQTIGLNYQWLIDLAKMAAEAKMYEDSQKVQAKVTPQTTAIRAAGPGPAIPGGPTYAAREAEEKEKAGLEREERMTQEQFAHEIELKGMELESKKATSLADAMSKERIAGVGAEAGVEQAQIGAAGQVAAAQKTTMEKGYEFVKMLMDMDKESANQLISNLEAKRTQQVEGPPSTITMGDITKELPGAAPTEDPNDPLTWLEEIGAYTEGGGAPRPKVTGAQKNPVEEFYNMVDDMIGGDIAGMAAMLSGEGGVEQLMEKIDTLGFEAGIDRGVIDSVKEIYRAMTGIVKVDPEEKEPYWGIPKAAKTTIENIAPFISQAIHPEERTPEIKALARQWEEAAEKVGEPSKEFKGFAKNLEEFVETIMTGPFHPAYTKWKEKRTEKPVEVEPTPTKEVGKITEQDVITDMGTWDKERIKEFQTVAKKAGIYKGPINGLHSDELDSAMRKYFKEHPEQWEVTE